MYRFKGGLYVKYLSQSDVDYIRRVYIKYDKNYGGR